MTSEAPQLPLYHILLIGIDAYDCGQALNGCVNDIDAVQRLLVDQLGIGVDRIKRLAAPRFGTVHEKDVPEALPTLANIRAAFEELGSLKVASGDRVFIYYAGHGTQCLIEGTNGGVYVREALVPKDHRSGQDRRYLFDWELNELLARIAGRTTSVTVVLDCCCSSGVTRGEYDSPDAEVRFLPSEPPFAVAPAQALSARQATRGLTRGVQDCHVVAACLDDERARESVGSGGDRRHGEFTRAFMSQLRTISSSELQELRWGRIWRALVAEIAALNPAQHPWMSGDLARYVFAGPPLRYDSGYQVTSGGGDTYCIDAGSISGVTEGAVIGVYGSMPAEFPTIGSKEDMKARIGELHVTHAARSNANAIAVAPFSVLPGARARLIAAGKAAKLVISLEPYDAELAANLGRSSLLGIANAGQKGDIAFCRRNDGGWSLVDDAFGVGDVKGEPVLVVVPKDKKHLARAIAEHYYAYSAPLRMAKLCNDLRAQLRVRLLDCNAMPPLTAEQAQAPDLPDLRPGPHAPFTVKATNGARLGDKVCFLVENLSDRGLLVALLDCQASGSVAILGKKKFSPGQQHCFWCHESLGTPFEASLPEGMQVGVDRIVLIGTTRLNASFEHLQVTTTFADILAPTRSAAENLQSGRDTQAVALEHWTSTVTAVRMER